MICDSSAGKGGLGWWLVGEQGSRGWGKDGRGWRWTTATAHKPTSVDDETTPEKTRTAAQPIKRTRCPSTRRPAKSWPMMAREGREVPGRLPALKRARSVSSAASLVQPPSCRTLREGAPSSACRLHTFPHAVVALPLSCAAPNGRPPSQGLVADPGDSWRFLAIPGTGPLAPDPGFPSFFQATPPSSVIQSSADLLPSCRASPGDQTVS